MSAPGQIFLKPRESSRVMPITEYAIRFCSQRDLALEIGCGNMTDGRFLANKFKRLTVVEPAKILAESARKYQLDNVEIVESTIEGFELPTGVDFVNANQVLHYVSKKEIGLVMENIKESLNQRGVFSGKLIGDRDSWIQDDPGGSYFSEKELREIFADFEIEKLEHIEYEGKNAKGKPKHWHLINFIAKKK